MQISRLLMKTFQSMGGRWNGIRMRFLAALKDSSGTSPWVFPGDPFIYTDSEVGPPTKVCLQYREINDALIAELEPHKARITGLAFSADAHFKNCQSEMFSSLTKYATFFNIENFAPSDVLVYLYVKYFRRIQLKLVSGFPNLEWLAIPCDCPRYSNNSAGLYNLSPLYKLKKLKHLNLQRYGEVINAKDTLVNILTAMPDLEYLDISETNLDEGGLHGLFELRKSRPLKFIGLYKTKHNGCLLGNIPADIVSGTANGQQRSAAYETCSDYMLGWEIGNGTVRNSVARLNLIIELMQLKTRTLDCGLRYLSTPCHYEVLTPRGLQVLFDTIIHFANHDIRSRIRDDSKKLYSILLSIAPKICTQNPSYVGRMLAHFIEDCWSSRFGGQHHWDQLREKDYKHLDIQDDSSICILNILNCQMKNVVLFVESLPPEYEWYDLTPSRMYTTRKIHGFVTRLFEMVENRAIDDFKCLFRRLEIWETTILPEKYWPLKLHCDISKS